jgi:hypothetical protein
LSLLYPDRDWKDKKFHEDHIFPKSEFTKAKLRARGFDEQTTSNYQKHFNTIANLQLLIDSENRDKSAKPFDDWFASRDANFRLRHSIPTVNSYSFEKFEEFIQSRKNVITEKLRAITI